MCIEDQHEKCIYIIVCLDMMLICYFDTTPSGNCFMRLAGCPGRKEGRFTHPWQPARLIGWNSVWVGQCDISAMTVTGCTVCSCSSPHAHAIVLCINRLARLSFGQTDVTSRLPGLRLFDSAQGVISPNCGITASTVQIRSVPNG